MVPFKGKMIPACAVETILGLPRRRIDDRLRKGWTVKRAVETPSSKSRSPNLITFDGITMSVADWDRKLGFNRGRVFDRLNKGWSVKRAVTTPARKAPCSAKRPPPA
jgi:hypothetical protein